MYISVYLCAHADSCLSDVSAGCDLKIATAQMEDELDEEDDDLIGPAPPDLVHEVENAGSVDRSKEVIRILRYCLACRTTCH